MTKPCLVCGTPSRQSRCALHRKTTNRGYGADHQRARARLALTLPAACAYGCGRTLHTHSDWVAAHVVDGHPEYGWQVACAPCNQLAKQR